MQDAGRWLIWVGVALVAIGLVVSLAPSIPWLGRLPGDLRIERPGLRIHIPIATCVLVSIVLTLVVNLLARLR